MALLVSLLIGSTLLGANIFGLTQSLRKPGLGVTDHEQLRFIPEVVWSYSKSLDEIEGLQRLDSREEIAEQANMIINRSLVHIDWERVDPREYRQLVPFWENYFLWAIGRFTDLPQFNRYHYADYRRSLQRGIGICGDASTALSSVMDRFNVPNEIISFKGHVIVEYEAENGVRALLDPDFGVSLGTSLQNLERNNEKVRERYLSAGYSEREINYLFEAYDRDYVIFDDTYHFMTQRYLFEKASYLLKWLLPFVLIFIPIFWAYRIRRRGNHR
ncbi:hypothetical protein [Marinobacter salsuginis]|uniref:hypothetical protein n=1 Tax=Marinobacter salsuginis TaxID=418719 RepID=UPI00273E0585|nr:hypothetical protein [Marinobacter salsuginis]